MIKTLSDLKRLREGTILRVVQGIDGAVGELRVIVKKSSGGVWLSMPKTERLSLLDYPKADMVKGTDKGFKIIYDFDFVLEYEIIKLAV